MRFLTAMVLSNLFLFVSSAIASGSQSVPVGREATWVHLDTMDHRIRGDSMGTVALDSSAIRRDCEANGEFSGIIRLTPVKRSLGMDDFGRLRVEIDCLAPRGSETG